MVGEDDEYNNVGFVKISGIFATQGLFSVGTVPFDGASLKYNLEQLIHTTESYSTGRVIHTSNIVSLFCRPTGSHKS